MSAFFSKADVKERRFDSVRMSAFGHKQSFAYRAYACILTVNQCPLSAKSSRTARPQYGHSERLLSGKQTFAALFPKPQPAAHFYELGLVEDGVIVEIPNYRSAG